MAYELDPELHAVRCDLAALLAPGETLMDLPDAVAAKVSPPRSATDPRMVATRLLTITDDGSSLFAWRLADYDGTEIGSGRTSGDGEQLDDLLDLARATESKETT